MEAGTRVRRRGAARAGLAVLVLLVAVAAVLGQPRAGAVFSATTGGPASTLASSACFSTGLDHVRSGTVTSTAAGQLLVTITPADPARSVLLFTAASNSNVPGGSTVRGTMVTATQLRFDRVTQETAPAAIEITWPVAAYYCGLRVQRGEVTMSTAAVDVPLSTPVSAVGQAFATLSWTTTATSSTWDANDAVSGDMADTTTLRLRDDGPFTTSQDDHLISWQVVELDPLLGAVVRATSSMTETATTVTATLPRAVDPTRTLLLASWTAVGNGPAIGYRLVQAALASGTQVTFTRSVTTAGQSLPLLTAVAVELVGARAQSGTAHLATGTATVTASVSAVNRTRSVALTTSVHGPGTSVGRTSYTGDDVLGVTSASITLPSSTSVQLRRLSTVGDADITWQVVELPK